MTMLEQVAKSLREFAAEMEVSSNGERSPDVMVHSMGLARVAIEAMRDHPSEEMLTALRNEASVSGYHQRGGPRVLRAVFNAALEEKP